MARRFITPYLLRDKLTLSCAIVLVLASIMSTSLILIYWSKDSHSSLMRQYQIVAEQSARKLTMALKHDSKEEAEAFLESFRGHPEIDAITVIKNNGDAFASIFVRKLGPNEQIDPEDRLHISAPIFVEGRAEGSVVVAVSLWQLQNATFRTACFLFGVNVFCLFAAVVGIYLMLQKISLPISSIVRTTNRIAEKGDYSIRAKKHSDDEIGKLADGFNRMLATIESQSEEIANQAESLARSKRMEGLGLLAGGAYAST